MNKANTESFSNQMAEVRTAHSTVIHNFNSVPLVKIRVKLAGPKERFASEEAVDAAREAVVAASGVVEKRWNVLNDFREQIKAEIHESLPQWKKDQLQREEEELQRSQEKEAAAALMAMSADDKE